MFRVDVDNLKDYLDFDPKRKSDLQKIDKLIRGSAPGLKRYFHRGTPAGEPGMRFKMIGYGKFKYVAGNGQYVVWPVVGVALQKNYISVYLSVIRDGASSIQLYAGKMGQMRTGQNNFSFRAYEDLDARLVASLFAEVEHIFRSNLRYDKLAHGGPREVRTR
jgi:hypothetical protein